MFERSSLLSRLRLVLGLLSTLVGELDVGVGLGDLGVEEVLNQIIKSKK